MMRRTAMRSSVAASPQGGSERTRALRQRDTAGSMGAHSDEPVRRFADAITSCDVEAALAVCDPEVAFLSVLAVDGRPYVGHEGIRRYFDDITSAWEVWRVDIHGT